MIKIAFQTGGVSVACSVKDVMLGNLLTTHL